MICAAYRDARSTARDCSLGKTSEGADVLNMRTRTTPVALSGACNRQMPKPSTARKTMATAEAILTFASLLLILAASTPNAEGIKKSTKVIPHMPVSEVTWMSGRKFICVYAIDPYVE